MGVTCSRKPCIAPLSAAGLLGCASSQPRLGGGLARPQSGSKLRPDICAELEEPRGLSLPRSATLSIFSSDVAPSDFLGLAADTERAMVMQSASVRKPRGVTCLGGGGGGGGTPKPVLNPKP
jgi:hypothetical protein